MASKEEKEINKLLDSLSDEIFEYSNKEYESAYNKVDKVRRQLVGIMADYANDDGKIPEYRIRAMLRELDGIEDDMISELEEAIEKSIKTTSKKVTNEVIKAMVATLGVAAVFGGASNRPDDDDVIVNDIVDFIWTRELNGVSMNSRIKRLSVVLRNVMQDAISQNILAGKTIHQISNEVKKVFERSAWHVKRFFTSEIPTALRKGLATVGGKTRVVKAIRIIDNRGRHRRHEEHMCYKYAETDKYGMGKGLYKPSDTYIFDPHPQCTAYFHYILDDSKLQVEGDD